MRVHRVAFVLLALLTVARSVAAQPRTLRGITYTVDTTTVDTTSEGRIVAGILDPLSLRVTYAEGRGRIDVLARAARPAVRIKWITVALNSALPGDYYLFDSAEVLHVRPGSKTFSRYTLADVSHNYEGRRDRWPFFRYDPERPNTLAGGTRPNEGTRSDFTVFWHAELTRDTTCTGAEYGKCLVRELARGRADVHVAPAEEGGVVRWVGPTRALAMISDLDSLIGAPIRLTAVEYWKAASGDGVAFLGAIRFFTGLRKIDVNPATLELPRGYTETLGLRSP
jgi:hypothetical protein